MYYLNEILVITPKCLPKGVYLYWVYYKCTQQWFGRQEVSYICRAIAGSLENWSHNDFLQRLVVILCHSWSVGPVFSELNIRSIIVWNNYQNKRPIDANHVCGRAVDSRWHWVPSEASYVWNNLDGSDRRLSVPLVLEE